MLPCCAFAQGGSCPNNWNSIDPNGNSVGIASYAGVKSCYYASKSIGSDSQYDGTSETVNGTHGPFAHIPGMQGCSGNCAKVTPAAGQGFIMRGGDTWSGGDLGVYWGRSGTGTGSQIYVGVDQNWFNPSCGSAWCRPVWNFSGVNADAFQADGGSRYWWFDNVEITALCNQESGVRANYASNIRASQLYFHGWTHCTNSNNVGFFTQGGPGSMADHNVIDGSDSSKNTFNGFFQSWSRIQFNYVQYVVSGVLGSTDSVHDNTFLHTVSSADGDHCNGVFTFSPLSGNSQLIYNNLIDNGTSCPGGVVLWFNGNGGTSSSWVGYGFGNVMYDLSSNPVNIGNHPSGDYGTYYWFNNTVDCTVGGCGGAPPSGPYWTIYDQNNHVIGSPLNFSCSGCKVPVCSAGSGSGCMDLTQTVAAANAQGYTASNNYKPISSCTSGSCSTLKPGADLSSSYCSTLSSIDSTAGQACQLSSGAGCSYNSSTHTLSCPNDAEYTRPSGGWQIGAFQTVLVNPPTPPTNLTGSAR
jgi:hypothetical protein